MINMLKFFLPLIFLISLSNYCFSEKILKIYFFERPPYNYTDKNGNVKGILIDKVRKIMDYIKVKYKFISLPAKRILYQIKNNDYACSPGWYKTQERLKKFKYTLPIYESQKIVAIVNKSITINDNISLQQLLNSNLTLGMISGFNYGPILEKYLKNYNFEKYTTEPDNLLKMVALKRIDYTFYSLDYVKNFIKKNPEFGKNLKIINVLDIKKGIKRYILCSKQVSDTLIKKMNEAILRLK